MRVETRNVPTKYFITDTFEIKLYDIISIVEDLEDTSYFGDMVMIYNTKLRDFLAKKGVLNYTIRGASCYVKSEKVRKSFLRKLYKLGEIS